MKFGFTLIRIATPSTSLLVLTLFLAATFCLLVPQTSAQTQTGTLRGQVTDPSGGAVVGASIVLTPSAGKTLTGQTNRAGIYEFTNLAADTYGVTVGATGFAVFGSTTAIEFASSRTGFADAEPVRSRTPAAAPTASIKRAAANVACLRRRRP